MKVRDAAFVTWALFIIAGASYGAARLALELGLGADLATVVVVAVFVSTFLMIDRPPSH